MNPRIPLPTVSDKDEKRNNRVQIQDSKITYWFIPPEIGALPIPLLKKNILGVVATFTRAGGECWATDTQLGEAFQWSRQKVNAAINEMVTAGLLRKDVTRQANGMTPRRLWIADNFPTLSPTVTTLATSHIDLVTHGDYPCHLEGLPLSPTVTTLVTHGDTNSNKLNKEKVIESIVADAPLPIEPLLKESLIDLDSVKEPFETLAEPETSDVTQPPQFREPPLPEPHRFVAAELSEAHRAKLLAQIKSPAQRAGLDPEKLLSEQLAACERWSHKDNKKDKFRDCWLATLQRQWIGKKIKELAANPKKPVGPSGLTYPQVETIFRDFWNEAHGLSRLDCRFVTEKQEPFIEKTYKTFARNENDFLEFLRKQDPHQFNKQWIQIWMQFKQIESEAAK